MPNHVQNRLTVAKEVIELYLSNDRFDFNKVVPQPAELVTDSINLHVKAVAESTMGMIKFDVTEPVDVRRAKNAIRNLRDNKLANEFDDERFQKFIDCLWSIRKTGFPSWYEWNIANWGTKWGAYECERVSDTVIEFQTAWNAPHKIIGSMFEKHDCAMLHEWADEDIGSNVGTASYKPGIEPCIIDLSRTKEGFELAFELHGEQPEYIRFNEAINNYEYVEME